MGVTAHFRAIDAELVGKLKLRGAWTRWFRCQEPEPADVLLSILPIDATYATYLQREPRAGARAFMEDARAHAEQRWRELEARGVRPDAIAPMLSCGKTFSFLADLLDSAGAPGEAIFFGAASLSGATQVGIHRPEQVQALYRELEPHFDTLTGILTSDRLRELLEGIDLDDPWDPWLIDPSIAPMPTYRPMPRPTCAASWYYLRNLSALYLYFEGAAARDRALLSCVG